MNFHQSVFLEKLFRKGGFSGNYHLISTCSGQTKKYFSRQCATNLSSYKEI